VVTQKLLLIRVKFVFIGILIIHIHANKEVMTMKQFATVYGFKNIQMMMSKTATGEMKMNGYHYAHLRIPNVFIQHETER
jgi:spore germination protein GerM